MVQKRNQFLLLEVMGIYGRAFGVDREIPFRSLLAGTSSMRLLKDISLKGHQRM
jgi:hypothetical protein